MALVKLIFFAKIVILLTVFSHKIIKLIKQSSVFSTLHNIKTHEFIQNILTHKQIAIFEFKVFDYKGTNGSRVMKIRGNNGQISKNSDLANIPDEILAPIFVQIIFIEVLFNTLKCMIFALQL